MTGNVARQKYLIVVLAAVVVGLAAFVGACALVYSTSWLISDDGGWYPVGAPPLLPPHWSPDGTRIVLDWWSGSYLVDARYYDVVLTEIVVEGKRERVDPHISSDGIRMAFSTGRDWFDEDDADIRLAYLDRSYYRHLTRSKGNQFGQRWSPDGSKIAFISCIRVGKDTIERTCSLYGIGVNGSGPRKLVDSVQATGGVAWSPDGRTIAFLGNELDQLAEWPKDQYIYIVDHDGSNLTRLTEASSQPAWSPDGSTIAFMRRDHGNSLFVMNPDGSELQRIANLYSPFMPKWAWTLSQEFSWSPDGSEILLQDYPFIRVNADGTDYPGKESHYAVFAGPEHWEVAYASWSQDGSMIAITVQQSGGNDPDEGEAFLLTMARDGSDKRVLVRIDEGGLYAVANEPWDGDGEGKGAGEWVWHSP